MSLSVLVIVSIVLAAVDMWLLRIAWQKFTRRQSGIACAELSDLHSDIRQRLESLSNLQWRHQVVFFNAGLPDPSFGTFKRC